MVFLLSGCGDTAPDGGGDSSAKPIYIRGGVTNSAGNTEFNISIQDVSLSHSSSSATPISTGLIVRINSTTLNYNSTYKYYSATVSGNYTGGASFNLTITGITPTLQNGNTYSINVNTTVNAPTTSTTNIQPTSSWSKSTTFQTITCTPGNGQFIIYNTYVSAYQGALRKGFVNSAQHLSTPIDISNTNSYTYTSTNTWDYNYSVFADADNAKIEITSHTYNLNSLPDYNYLDINFAGTNQGQTIRYNSGFLVREPVLPIAIIRNTSI